MSGLTPLVPGVSGDARRAESVAGFANINADYAGSTAEAADQKALEAATAADGAMYEAQFGNIAVGRLLAGSLKVNQYIESTSYSPGSSGWRINADGSAEFNSAVFRGHIESSSITVSGADDYFKVSSAGAVNMAQFTRDGGSELIGFDYTGATGWYIRLSAAGGVYANGSEVAVVGSRTSGLAAWEGTSTSGPNFTSFDSSHNHAVPQHRHTVTV